MSPPGFEISLSQDLTVTASIHPNHLLNANFSRVAVTIHLHRRFGPILLTSFMPPIFIILSLITSFFLPPSLSATRYSLSGSALVSAVLFHAGIANPANEVGKIDIFMLLIYLLILSSLVIATRMVAYSDRQEKVRVERLIMQTRAAIILLAPWWFSLVFFEFWQAMLICLIGPIISVGLYYLARLLFHRYRIWQRIRQFVNQVEGQQEEEPPVFEVIGTAPPVEPDVEVSRVPANTRPPVAPLYNVPSMSVLESLSSAEDDEDFGGTPSRTPNPLDRH
jgi:hypothetical protein